MVTGGDSARAVPAGGAGAEGRDKVGLRREDGDEGTKGTRGGGDREEMEVTRLWWRGQQRGHGDDSGDRDKMGAGHGAGDMERTWRWWWGHGHGGGNQQEMVKVTADRGGDAEMANVTWRWWWGHGDSGGKRDQMVEGTRRRWGEQARRRQGQGHLEVVEVTRTWWWHMWRGEGGGDRKMEMEMGSVMCRGWWGHGEDVKGGIWRCSR